MGKNPAWGMYIVWYFFIGGIAGGAYFMAAVVDFFGRRGDRPVAKIGYSVALPLILISPILLTLDLGMPPRTFNMFTMFKFSSPMSVGSWALLGFGLFSLLSVLLLFAEEGASLSQRAQRIAKLRRALAIPGGILGFFVASYTGVLLGSTNRPFWASSQWIGALFLVSGVSAGVAAIALLRWILRFPAPEGLLRLKLMDQAAIVAEAILLILFLRSLGPLAGLMTGGAFAPLFWGGLVVVGLVLPFLAQLFSRRGVEVFTAIPILVGVFFLRYLVLMAGQG